jgi:hypothetical protein
MTTFDPKTQTIVAIPVVLKNEGVAGRTTEEMIRSGAIKPVCSQVQPAPKGEPIFPGARAAHIARPDWDHPDVEITSIVISGGFVSDPHNQIANAFRPIPHAQCRHCGGNV